MSRRPRRAHASSEPAAAAPPRSLEGRLVGYRLLRRIASGERADVYLAVADDPEPQTPSTTREVVGDGGAVGEPGPRVVVLRVYDADLPGETITTEVEAMSTDASARCPRSSTSRRSTTAGAASWSSASVVPRSRGSSPSAR